MRLDDHFWPTMLSLAECLCQEIARSQLPEPCFCGVLAGGVPVLDFCTCDAGCGQAWVRLVQVLPTVTEGTAVNPCNAPLEASVEVGIVRCAPMPGDDGQPPSLADQLEAAQLQAADMAASLRAIRCCDAIGAKDFGIVSWTSLGPDGDCLGGAWNVTLYGT